MVILPPFIVISPLLCHVVLRQGPGQRRGPGSAPAAGTSLTALTSCGRAAASVAAALIGVDIEVAAVHDEFLFSLNAVEVGVDVNSAAVYCYNAV